MNCAHCAEHRPEGQQLVAVMAAAAAPGAPARVVSLLQDELLSLAVGVLEGYPTARGDRKLSSICSSRPPVFSPVFSSKRSAFVDVPGVWQSHPPGGPTVAAAVPAATSRSPIFALQAPLHTHVQRRWEGTLQARKIALLSAPTTKVKAREGGGFAIAACCLPSHREELGKDHNCIGNPLGPRSQFAPRGPEGVSLGAPQAEGHQTGA